MGWNTQTLLAEIEKIKLVECHSRIVSCCWWWKWKVEMTARKGRREVRDGEEIES